MARHPIKDEKGRDTKLFWSDSDGDWDPDRHQSVYVKTPSGAKEVKDLCYDRQKGTFHKK